MDVNETDLAAGRAGPSGARSETASGGTHDEPLGLSGNGSPEPVVPEPVTRGVPDHTANSARKPVPFMLRDYVTINNAEVARWGKKQFPISARHIHFILTSAATLLRRYPPVWWEDTRKQDDIERLARELDLDTTLVLQGVEGMIALIEQAIAAAIERTAGEIAETLAQTEVALRAADIAEPAPDPERQPVRFDLATPLARRLLKVVIQADRLAGMIYALWMMDYISFDEHQKKMYAKVRQPLMKFFHLTRDLHGYLCRRWPYRVKDIYGNLLDETKDPRIHPDLANPPLELLDEVAKLETRINSQHGGIVMPPRAAREPRDA